MAMNILEQEQGLKEHGWGSPNHLHAGIEAMRLSFADALSLVADPEVRSSTCILSIDAVNHQLRMPGISI